MPPPPSPVRRRSESRRAGFTLVEVLITVAIVVVLLTLALSMAATVRRQARSTMCQGKLRELLATYHMYTMQNDGHGFLYDGSAANKLWIDTLEPFHQNIEAARFCPEATTPSTQAGNWGTAFMAWGPGASGFLQNNSGSYGFNGWLYVPRPTDAMITNSFWNYNPAALVGFPPLNAPYVKQTFNAFVEVTQVGSDRVPVLFDCAWVDAWPHEYDPLPYVMPYNAASPELDLNTGKGIAQGSMMARVCLARHDRYVNVGFLDGSVRLVQLSELWTLKWSNEFKSTKVVIP